MKATSMAAFGLVVLLLIVSYLESQNYPDSPSLPPPLNDSADTGAQGWNIKDYQTARPVFWGKLYSGGGITLYCAQPFNGSGHRGLNIEHVFPMSWVINALDCGTRNQCRQRSSVFNVIEADLHNLYPVRSDVNKDRASFRFAEIRGETRLYGKNCDFEVDERARTVEPFKEVRGDIARAMFYMVNRYADSGLRLFAKQRRLLARWHRIDPPDSSERRRNQQIERLQGNANIFISRPAELDHLLAEGRFD